MPVPPPLRTRPQILRTAHDDAAHLRADTETADTETADTETADTETADTLERARTQAHHTSQAAERVIAE